MSASVAAHCRLFRTAFLLFACLWALSPPGLSQTRPRPDPQTTRTSWGRVIGRVYEAETGRPIRGASVSVRNGGQFAETGKTVSKTDAYGGYSVQAPLGRVSENFDLGRALNSGIAGLLLGGATNRTKRVDVTRLDLKVTAPGYRPYAGPVSCRDADAAKFAVTMEPVLLVRDGAPQASAVADGWGPVRLLDVTAAPEVVEQGSEIVVSASVYLPVEDPRRGFLLQCTSPTLGSKRLEVVGTDEGGRVRFEARIRAPRVRATTSEPITVGIVECPLDVASSGRVRSVEVQFVANPSDRPLAEGRAVADRAQREGDYLAAFARWQEVCAGPGASSADFRRLADVAARLNEHGAAMKALEQAVERASERVRDDVRGDHALALVRAGQPGQVISAYAPLVEEGLKSSRRRRTSLPLLIAVGESYLATGRLEDAERVLEEIHEWPGALPAEAIALRSAFRYAAAQRRMASDPTPGARLHLARVLMDLGRWEEALAAIEPKAGETGAVPTADAEISYAVRQVVGASSADDVDLDRAIEDAAGAAVMSDGKKTIKSEDFHTWHRYAMLLYRRAVMSPAEAPSRSEDLSRCIAALEEAVRTGRAGARVNEGVYAGPLGYASARVVAVTGFAYPEAAWDFVLVESLRILSTAADDEYALLNMAAALVELNQDQTARIALDRVARIRPDDPEVCYLQAVVAMRAGDAKEAVSRARRALDLNPRHPRARLLLARVDVERGDIAGAAAAIAEHTAVYGSLADAQAFGGTR